jgi:hypothetical protein
MAKDLSWGISLKSGPVSNDDWIVFGLALVLVIGLLTLVFMLAVIVRIIYQVIALLRNDD